MLTNPVPTTDGYTFKVSNYSLSDTYVFLAGPGVAVANTNGAISISGLEPGQSASVTVESYANGKVIGKTTITGHALGSTGSQSNQNGSSQSGTSTSTTKGSPGATSSSGAGTNASLLNLQSGKAGISVGTHENSVQTEAGAAGVTIGNGQVGMTLHPSSGASISGVGNVQLVRGGTLLASGYGLEPGSTATVALYSPEISIGKATVTSKGTFTLRAPLPSGLALGHHTLVLRGVNAKHQPVMLGLGLNVAAPRVAAPTPFPLRQLLAGIAGAIVLGVAGWWFLLAWRRRREEEEETATLLA